MTFLSTNCLLCNLGPTRKKLKYSETMQVTIARTAMDQLAPGIGKELDHFIQKFSR